MPTAEKSNNSLFDSLVYISCCLLGVFFGYNIYAGFGKSPKEEWFKSNYCELDTIIERKTIVPVYAHDGYVIRFQERLTDTVKYKCKDSVLTEVRNYDD